MVNDGVYSQSDSFNLHDRSQNVDEHLGQPEMELVQIELAKKKSLVEWNSMDGEGEQDEFISGNEEGTSSEGEETEILTIKDEERVQKVVVKKESRTLQFLPIQESSVHLHTYAWALCTCRHLYLVALSTTGGP